MRSQENIACSLRKSMYNCLMSFWESVVAITKRRNNKSSCGRLELQTQDKAKSKAD